MSRLTPLPLRAGARGETKTTAETITLWAWVREVIFELGGRDLFRAIDGLRGRYVRAGGSVLATLLSKTRAVMVHVRRG